MGLTLVSQCDVNQLNKYFFQFGPFYFHLFSQINEKMLTQSNYDKNIDSKLGIPSWGRRSVGMEGGDESTELWRPARTQTFNGFSIQKIPQNESVCLARIG